ncbi:39S ribosomal protein L46, mitochondrial [Sitophilus oryzae]|uniref:Large ribosomal subunit protein mL46 n=1 Tax=Sitophilus oryzae TaxID=7048 RepID=A0A6J2Y1N2_SITOR|nr:39S ribosomal protein L46, mitochondrial [Sitophilus oryzae]
MFRNTLRIILNTKTKNIQIINKANLKTTAELKQKWDLLTAVLIERKPVIIPELNELEKAFQDYIGAVEFERSLKNDFEIRLEKEKNSKTQDVTDVDIVVKQSAQDFLDSCKEELAKFTPADKKTSADRSNDIKSLKRKLDKHLVLVLKQKVGSQDFFILPQGEREDGETLRQCAERVLKEKCGSDIKAHIYGNIPCGFYKYLYPHDVRKERNSLGAKIFIYFARYKSGQISDKKSEYQWLDKSELDGVLPEPYKKTLLPILFD